jgi:hypothetical protein
MKKLLCTALTVGMASLVAAGPACAQDNEWEFGLGIYGWFPDISGRTSFPIGEDQDINVEIGDILDNLDFTFQGNFDARKGRWGLFTDAIYLDLGATQQNLREGTIGGSQIPTDLGLDVGVDVKSLLWTTSAYYRFVDQGGTTVDGMAGVRYTDVEQSLGWTVTGNIANNPLPGREGSAKVSQDFWDFIVGVRGKWAFGSEGRWYVPWYGDIGTGDSDFTWQAAAGVGYAFDWGEVAAVWRVLDYDLPTDSAIGDLEFSGPAVGIAFRW